MGQNTLYVGGKSLLVKWNEQIDYVLCLFYNHILQIKNIFKWNLHEHWIANNVDTRSGGSVYIYGVKSSGSVLVSTMVKLSSDQTQHILLIKHSEMNSIIYSSNTSTLSQKMSTTVDQRIQGNSNGVVFKFTQNDLRPSYKYIQFIQLDQNGFNEYINIATTNSQEIPCAWRLPSRLNVTYQIYEIHRETVLRESEKQSMVTHNTKNDVLQLYQLAEDHRQNRADKKKISKSIPVTCLFRNKPTNHPTIQELRETGIMRKYIKDKNGDQASSINNQINGLFFSASVNPKTKEPPSFSFFGDYRIKIPPEHMLPDCNMYFADFYCQAPQRKHYVTLVLTKPGSVEDNYCQQRLVKLDLYNNKFLYYQASCPGYEYRATRFVHVEVLYTEDVPVNQMKREGLLQEETTTNVRGRGHSKEHGIPKYTDCQICNF